MEENYIFENIKSIEEYDRLNENKVDNNIELALVFGDDYADLDVEFKVNQLKYNHLRKKKEYKVFDEEYDMYLNDLYDVLNNNDVIKSIITTVFNNIGMNRNNKKLINKFCFSVLKFKDFTIENVMDEIREMNSELFKSHKISNSKKDEILNNLKAAAKDSKTFSVFMKNIQKYNNKYNIKIGDFDFIKALDLDFNFNDSNIEKMKEFYKLNK